MDEKAAYKNGDNKQFIVNLYKKSLIFESKNHFISIKLDQSNNCCLYYLKAKNWFL